MRQRIGSGLSTVNFTKDTGQFAAALVSKFGYSCRWPRPSGTSAAIWTDFSPFR
jgi:hypothetical protein